MNRPVQQFPGETRIPMFAPHFSPLKMVRNLFKFTNAAAAAHEFRKILQGKTTLNALTFAPLDVREHRASLWAGPQGIALRGMTPQHDFEIAWQALSEVQVVWSCNLVMRVDTVVLVLVPQGPDPLAAAPPGLVHYLSPDAPRFEITLYMDQQVPTTFRAQVLDALRPHAGPLLVD